MAHESVSGKQNDVRLMISFAPFGFHLVILGVIIVGKGSPNHIFSEVHNKMKERVVRERGRDL